MVRIVLLSCMLFATCAFSAVASDFTQRDFARLIVETYGWEGGLPKEPSDRDYLLILAGKRTTRYEAESVYNPKTDRVTIERYSRFGPFTGKGWLNGVSEPVDVNFTVQLPIGGNYILKTVQKGDGAIWHVGDASVTVNPGGSFREVEVGRFTLPPGLHQFKVVLPKSGSIDSFSLSAPDYVSIQPFVGWRFSEPLTAARLAEVGVALRDAYSRLPEGGGNSPEPVEAMSVVDQSQNVSSTDAGHHGQFSSKRWVRADFHGATVRIPFKVAETGLYIIRARVMGKSIQGEINGDKFSVEGKPYLAFTDLGLYRLPAGDNLVMFQLPPAGGIDVITFVRRDTSTDAFMKLGDVAGPPERTVVREEALRYITAIKAKEPTRK